MLAPALLLVSHGACREGLPRARHPDQGKESRPLSGYRESSALWDSGRQWAAPQGWHLSKGAYQALFVYSFRSPPKSVGGSEIAERWSLKMGPRGKSKGRTSLRRVK